MLRSMGRRGMSSSGTLVLAAIFAGVAISLFLRYNTGSGQDQRRITIDRIEMNIAALTNYAIDNGGSFPTGDQGLKALVEKPTTGPLPHNWRGPYVSDKRALRDAWDMPFHYVSPGDKRPEYDLWSNGADRAEGGEGPDADVQSWNRVSLAP